MVDEDRFAVMLAEVRPHLNELQWRLLLGAQARSLGRGGIKRVAVVAGFARTRWAGEPGSWSRALSRRAGFAGPGRDGAGPGKWMRAWFRRWTAWSIRLPAVTRSRRCGG